VFFGFGRGLPANTTTASSKHSANTRVLIIMYHPHWLRRCDGACTSERINQMRQQVQPTVMYLEEKKDVAKQAMSKWVAG
jgi:hypothetical protein